MNSSTGGSQSGAGVGRLGLSRVEVEGRVPRHAVPADEPALGRPVDHRPGLGRVVVVGVRADPHPVLPGRRGLERIEVRRRPVAGVQHDGVVRRQPDPPPALDPALVMLVEQRVPLGDRLRLRPDRRGGVDGGGGGVEVPVDQHAAGAQRVDGLVEPVGDRVAGQHRGDVHVRPQQVPDGVAVFGLREPPQPGPAGRALPLVVRRVQPELEGGEGRVRRVGVRGLGLRRRHLPGGEAVVDLHQRGHPLSGQFAQRERVGVQAEAVLRVELPVAVDARGVQQRPHRPQVRPAAGGLRRDRGPAAERADRPRQQGERAADAGRTKHAGRRRGGRDAGPHSTPPRIRRGGRSRGRPPDPPGGAGRPASAPPASGAGGASWRRASPPVSPRSGSRAPAWPPTAREPGGRVPASGRLCDPRSRAAPRRRSGLGAACGLSRGSIPLRPRPPPRP